MMISIIIAAYNAQKYIQRAIQSILSQKCTIEFEIIIIDDGSADNTLNICRLYEHKYNNVRVIHKKNEGVSVARNRGINAAKGTYLFFLDSDDFFYENNVFEKVENYLLDGRYDVILGNAFYYDGIKKPNLDLYLGNYCNPERLINCFLQNNELIPWQPWRYFVRKKFILENGIFFPSNITNAEDCFFFFSLIKNKAYFKVIDVVFIYYFLRYGSITNTISKDNVNSAIKVFGNIGSKFSDNKLIKKNMSEHYLDYMPYYIFLNEKNIDLLALKKTINLHFQQKLKVKYQLYNLIWKTMGYKLGSRLIIHLKKNINILLNKRVEIK